MTPEDRTAIAQETAIIVVGRLLPWLQAQTASFQMQEARIAHMHMVMPAIDSALRDIVAILQHLRPADAATLTRPQPKLSLVPEAPQPNQVSPG